MRRAYYVLIIECPHIEGLIVDRDSVKGIDTAKFIRREVQGVILF